MAAFNKPSGKSWSELSKAEQRQIAMHLEGLRETNPVKPPVKQKGQFQLKGYVRCELSSADKDAFVEWEKSHRAGDAWQVLVALVDSGYLFKAGEGKDAFQASLSAADTSTSWDGYVLTAFASSADRAMTLLLYKHGVMMQGDWSAWTNDAEGDFFR